MRGGWRAFVARSGAMIANEPLAVPEQRTRHRIGCPNCQSLRVRVVTTRTMVMEVQPCEVLFRAQYCRCGDCRHKWVHRTRVVIEVL